tara:strand:+ start:48 stop:164 length:117 start_codon:yes stop_codon:yes gene_type:complete
MTIDRWCRDADEDEVGGDGDGSGCRVDRSRAWGDRDEG